MKITMPKLSNTWARSWGKQMSFNVFGSVPKKKMTKAEFAKHSEACTQYGFIQAVEHLILMNEVEELTHDEFMGEIHLMLMHEYNKFRMNNLGNTKTPPSTIEGILARASKYKSDLIKGLDENTVYSN